tara:strand:+ start:9419 stop:10294 length:876 start_codon:yes stop_codon:yes gene_type:complete
MKNSIIPFGVGLNQVLLKHLEFIFSQNEIPTISNKNNFKKGYLVLKKSFSIKKRNILIYNTSVFNTLLLIILRLNKNKIYFHLHDPIPHSGLLNPIIFITNFFLTLFSHEILVFSKKLKNQTSKIYKKSTIHIMKHGMNSFVYNQKLPLNKKTYIGFFGRNMPYKNYNHFVEYVKKNPKYNFITVGKGFQNMQQKNHLLISGYISDNDYYSYMTDVDYLYFSHSKISYSGVLSDAKFLNKMILVPNQIYRLINFENKLKQSSKKLKKIKRVYKSQENNWFTYKKKLNNIIK